MRERAVIGAAEMDAMSPQARADAVNAGQITSWDDVPEPFRSDVLAMAKQLGESRRARG
jgi:hypothetical protein